MSISSETVVQSISCSLGLNASWLMLPPFTFLSLLLPLSYLCDQEMSRSVNQSSQALCSATFLHATVRLEMRWAGWGWSFVLFFFFWLITPLPLSYFSLLSVIALAWNVVHGAFTRSISHAEAEHSNHRSATDRLKGWWDDSSEHSVSSMEEGSQIDLSEAVKLANFGQWQSAGYWYNFTKQYWNMFW